MSFCGRVGQSLCSLSPGAEVLTDSYPCEELYDGVLYKIKGKVCSLCSCSFSHGYCPCVSDLECI